MSDHRLADSRTYVYRLFDRQGRLIYVGATVDPETRISVHRQTTWWGPQIHRIKIKVYPNRQQANDAEKEAIRTEHPRWNINLRTWGRKNWSAQNIKDFIQAMEMFDQHLTEPRQKRIATAKRMLTDHDAGPDNDQLAA